MAGIGELRLAENAGIAALQKPVLEACQKAWQDEWVAGKKNFDNCSGFVKSVCQALGVAMVDGRADAIVDYIDGDDWVKLPGPTEARAYAAAGCLVLAGLKGADHARARDSGHVVVIVDGPLYKQKYPLCWGGSTSTAQSNGSKSVGEVWGQLDRDTIGYYRQK